MSDILRDARLRAPGVVLLALHEEALKARASGGELARILPRVKIETQWGQRYEGRVLAVETEGVHFRVLFALESAPGALPALAYLDLVEPFQMIVFDAEAQRRLLRFGEVGRWSEDEVGGLELKRVIQRTRQQLTAANLALIVDQGLEGDQPAFNAVLRDVLVALGEYVDRTRNEAVGKEALTAIREVSVLLAAGSALRVTREGATLALTLDPAEGLGDRAAFFASLDAAL